MERFVLWVKSRGLPSQRVSSIEVRGQPAQVQLIQSALALLEQYHPAARRRIEANVRLIVAVAPEPTASTRREVGTLFLNFAHANDDSFQVAMTVLANGTDILARKRMQRLRDRRTVRGQDVSASRAGALSAKRFILWRAVKAGLPREYKLALLNWTDERIQIAGMSERARLLHGLTMILGEKDMRKAKPG